jgi:hypothetical protein
MAATLTGYAYETIAGRSIKAGQTKGAASDWEEEIGSASLSAPVPVSPQPARLGAQAVGELGMSIWRRKESLEARAI